MRTFTPIFSLTPDLWFRILNCYARNKKRTNLVESQGHGDSKFCMPIDFVKFHKAYFMAFKIHFVI